MRALFLLILLSLPVTALGAGEFNAGFVQGLWLDTDEVFVGDTVRIYAAVRNNTDADLTGTVEFYDDATRIGRKSISALDGRIVESWTDWRPDYGEHTISAELSRIELHQIGSTTRSVTVTSELAEQTVFVDYDTDQDGIGNEHDSDDDGDGIDDVTEEENDTDPLDPNDPEMEAVETEVSENATGGDRENKTKEQDNDPQGNTTNSSGPAGMEQYLTNNRASYALASITDIVNDLKRNLDTYRDRRKPEHDTANETDVSTTTVNDQETLFTGSSTSSTTEITTNEAGFGDVTRGSDESDVGILTTLTELLRTLIESLYTIVLFMLSLYLSHPIIVQLTLLILILFLIYKLARRLGQRQQ